MAILSTAKTQLAPWGGPMAAYGGSFAPAPVVLLDGIVMALVGEPIDLAILHVYDIRMKFADPDEDVTLN